MAMAYEFEWDTSGLGKTPAAYHLVVETTGTLTLSSARGATTLTVGGPGASHELYLPEGWQIEVTRSRGEGQATIDLVLMRTGVGSKTLKATFEEGVAHKVSVAVARERAEMREFSDVSSVTLGADVVRVEEGAADPGKDAYDPKDTALQEAIKAVKKELDDERKAHAAAEERAAEAERRAQEAEARVAEAEAAKARVAEAEAAEARAAEAESQVDALQERVVALEQTVKQVTAGQFKGLAEHLSGTGGISDELIALLAEAEKLVQTADEQRQRLVETRGRIATLEREVEEAKQEAAQLDKLEEARTLDLEAARADLEELKAQLSADGQTSDLMASDPFLLGNSVRKTLDKVRKELLAAERRIGAIIRYRETYLGGVHQAIWSGDGSIPLENDLQRGYDGDGSTAAEED